MGRLFRVAGGNERVLAQKPIVDFEHSYQGIITCLGSRLLVEMMEVNGVNVLQEFSVVPHGHLAFD